MTPIEELIEKLKVNPILNANVLHTIESMELLKKEEKLIVNTFKDGWACGADFHADPQDYYNKKYKSK